MYPRRNHNYILPLEKSLSEALKIYGERFRLTIAVYGVCVIFFLLVIIVNNIFQAVSHFLYPVFIFGLSFLKYMFSILIAYPVVRKIIREVIKSLHIYDVEESKQTEEIDN